MCKRDSDDNSQAKITLILENTQRLGLVGRREVPEVAFSEDDVDIIRKDYYITTFGVRFIEACRKPGTAIDWTTLKRASLGA